jgi:G3E family GTPase
MEAKCHHWRLRMGLTPESDKRTNIILISGFLGAGKTTLIKNIIALKTDMSDTVIVLNEFGKIGIDGMMLNDTDYDVVTLSSGCICCTLAMDLEKQLKKIKTQMSPRKIIIEASGVADPVSIVPVLQKFETKHNMALDKVITVIDAECWQMREIFGTLFYSQLEMADMILLNKIDRHHKKKVSLFIKEIHEMLPNTQIIPTIHSKVDPDIFWSKDFTKIENQNRGQIIHADSVFPCYDEPLSNKNEKGIKENRKIPDSGYEAFSFKEKVPMDEACFNRFVKDLPFEVFRLKGIVSFSDHTAFFNYVGGKGRWSKWEGPSETYLEFVGWNIAPDKIVEKLKRCVTDKSTIKG